MARKVNERPPVTAEAPAKGFSLISDTMLRDLHIRMLRCRELMDRVRPLDKAKKSRIQRFPEAVVVGTTIDLKPGDWVVPWEHDVLASFVKGASLKSILASFREDPVPDPSMSEIFTGLQIVPPALSVENQIDVAVGVALANKRSKNSNVTVALCPDPLPSRKRWRQSVNLAGELSLPILFVFAEGVSSQFKAGKKKKKKDAPVVECGFPVIPVDAHDVVAMYRVAHESLLKARNGLGPTLIEAKNLPGSDDPISKMEGYLVAKGLFDESWKQRMADRFKREVDTALQ